MDDKIYIVLVNWNGWRDTIECLESVFRNSHPNYTVIVCDNDSSDGSLEQIEAWADGCNPLPPNDSEIRQRHCFPEITKPISHVTYSRAVAEQGGTDGDCSLVLITAGANLGFAGGNNVGIRFALARDDFSYVWLLNNDTVVHPQALLQLVERMKAVPAAGMAGSTVVYHDNPERIQAQGGASYVKWLGMGRHIGQGCAVRSKLPTASVEAQLDYILGASLLVSKPFLKNIGLMNEEYFLYFEELDWALRAGDKFSLAYAPDSLVYHKEGSSIGTNASGMHRSLKADYYLFKNRLVITRKYFPGVLPAVYLRLLVAAATRAVYGKWRHAGTILRILVTGK